MNSVQSRAGHRRSNAIDGVLMVEVLASTALWVPARSAADRATSLVQALVEVGGAHTRELHLQDATCPICLRSLPEIMEEKDALVRLDCNNGFGHMFCRKDIVRWLEAEKTTCPMCRSGLVDPNAVEEGGHFLIIGGTQRLLEHCAQQGIPANTGGTVSQAL